MFKAYVTYLWYVIRHKYHVYVECRKLGVGIWQSLIHDLNKFSFTEFGPYAIWFYKRPTDPIKLKEAENSFNLAWLHHIRKNPHHWQYWVLNFDTGGVTALRMPEKYVREMVADWRGVAKTLRLPDTNAKEWYLKNRNTMSLHNQTRNRVEVLLGVVDPLPDKVVVKYPQSREIGAS